MPGASSSDLKFLVRDVLLSNSEVFALVGSNVRGQHVYEPDLSTVKYPMVILEMISGYATTNSVQRATLDVYAYSRESAGNALRIYDACQKALQQELLRRDGIDVAGYAVEQARPNEGYNDIVRAFYAQGEFTVRMVNR